jgi:hypothetical protein
MRWDANGRQSPLNGHTAYPTILYIIWLNSKENYSRYHRLRDQTGKTRDILAQIAISGEEDTLKSYFNLLDLIICNFDYIERLAFSDIEVDINEKQAYSEEQWMMFEDGVQLLGLESFGSS